MDPAMSAPRGRPAPRYQGRGVSPIIATILLVAIVVVLAAVLYALIGNLSSGRSNVPIGTALALGPATATSGSAATSPYCKSGHGCYSVTIASASTSLTVGDLEFALKTSSGADHLVSKGTGQFTIAGPSGKVVAQSPAVAKGKPLVVTSWTFPTKGYTASTPVSSLMTLWVEFGTAITQPAGNGFVLAAVGTGTFQGEVLLTLP
jgi:flagellin-like protein